MNIVFFLSCNGIAPAVIAGTILENLEKILNPKLNFKLILKTDDKLRYLLLSKNYNKNIQLNPKYVIKESDLVFHIIDPRNIKTCGKDIFIDCLGDYWSYINKKKLFELRLKLYIDGTVNSDYFFGTSFFRKNIYGKRLHNFGFIDKHIKQLPTNGSNICKTVFIGSYKKKNKLYDDSLAHKKKINFVRSINRKKICRLFNQYKFVIVHPGINTIAESIYLNKPFLYIAPANIEQTYNTKFIKRHKLGVVITDASLQNIQRGIYKLKCNYNIYKKNIETFCSKYNISFETELYNFLKRVYYENSREIKL